MKRLLALALLVVAAGLTGYAIVRFRAAPGNEAANVASGADIAWLKTEFDLSEAQFAGIRKLHEDYGTVCAGHCIDIAEAQERIDQLRTSGAAPAEIAAAEAALADLEAVCNRATREHIRRVAALMAPPQGARFLRMTEPHLASMPHDGVRGLGR